MTNKNKEKIILMIKEMRELSKHQNFALHYGRTNTGLDAVNYPYPYPIATSETLLDWADILEELIYHEDE